MANERVFLNSIVLIGPSGAGKSTVAKALTQFGMQNFGLDYYINLKRMQDEPEEDCLDHFYMNTTAYYLDAFVRNNVPFVLDFGATQTCLKDAEAFARLQNLLNPFKNVVLLLPCPDTNEALKTLNKRSTGQVKNNAFFLNSGLNEQLAKQIVYTDGKMPEQIATEILLFARPNLASPATETYTYPHKAGPSF